ncbi:folylpolyglutamate synthase/dihydrofolate synthase family protein [Nitrospirillum sp. BR 11163]|uniref:bifunctional folylpolyglutamate synthase/dihydrofolate synthase n=1 Tax=Nitrospirillum sp. BR 11163 TaxID=3104323 RepID=UPI002AFDD928|nr:folylpolyglutamate synthase/dihydrofolate synthase family protein [Nitrospirillum sp. BR 11163]MEA1677653.1 folylpolyglutamate synthase/dihydrofolate synthase family protein [Nitrospirillum sp. BR 11163]
MSDLDQVLARLGQLHPKVIDLSLDRVKRLLDRLGRPQDRLPPVVHVAGTNGKGSTIAFLRAMLEAAGHRVHVYTSPHLVRFNERVRLAGNLVDDAGLVTLLERCEAANQGDPITIFEIITCAAFLGYSEVPADVLLLETGLGGRLDATNVVDQPAVAVVTRISFDHTQFLGDTLDAIAGEKAGIFKAGRPAVVGPQAADVPLSVFRDRAAVLAAPLAMAGAEWSALPTDIGFRFEGYGRTLDLPMPGLLGAHQIGNAGTAIAALQHLPLTVQDANIVKGLATVEWPGRLQRLTRGPLARLLPNTQLWLDGGHNNSAGEVLGLQARAWTALKGNRDGGALDLVVGMITSKVPADFLRPIAPYVRRLAAISIPGEEATRPASDIAEAARAVGIAEVTEAAGVAEAIASLAARGAAPRTLICGSLYLAGSILADNG